MDITANENIIVKENSLHETQFKRFPTEITTSFTAMMAHPSTHYIYESFI